MVILRCHKVSLSTRLPLKILQQSVLPSSYFSYTKSYTHIIP